MPMAASAATTPPHSSALFFNGATGDGAVVDAADLGCVWTLDVKLVAETAAVALATPAAAGSLDVATFMPGSVPVWADLGSSSVFSSPASSVEGQSVVIWEGLLASGGITVPRFLSRRRARSA